MQRTGKALGRDSFKRTLSSLSYDNGLSNPINFAGGQVGSHAVVITKGDASSRKQNEIDSNWSSDY